MIKSRGRRRIFAFLNMYNLIMSSFKQFFFLRFFSFKKKKKTEHETENKRSTRHKNCGGEDCRMETNNIYIVFIFEYRIVFKIFSFVPCFSFNKLRDQMNHSHARTHTHAQTDRRNKTIEPFETNRSLTRHAPFPFTCFGTRIFKNMINILLLACLFFLLIF